MLIDRFNYVYETEYLYTPINGQAKDDRVVFEEHFPNNDTHLFIAERKVDEEGFLRVILTDQSDAKNIWTEAGLEKIRDVDRHIKAFMTKDDNLTYAELCGMWKGTCYDNAIIRLTQGQDFDSIVITYPHFGFDFLGNELGDVTTDENTTVLSAGSVLLTYHVRYLDSSTEKKSSEWMEEVLESLLDLKTPDTLLSVASTDSLDEELHSISGDIVPLFAGAYVLLCCFSMFSCMMFDWVRNKMMVATAGQVSTGMAIVSGMALLVVCGVPFASIVSTMPFLLMGESVRVTTALVS